MNTTKRLEPQTRSVLSRQKSEDRQELIKTVPRFAGIVAALLIAVCASNSAELPRPGDSIDAGDSYRLKDGSRLALYRVVNEVAIKHLDSEPIDPVLQEAGVDRDLLVQLASINGEKSHVVDLYQVADSQAVDKLLSAQADGAAVYPVLMDPASRRRMIATDEIIVQFAGNITTPQAAALINHGFWARLMP